MDRADSLLRADEPDAAPAERNGHVNGTLNGRLRVGQSTVDHAERTQRLQMEQAISDIRRKHGVTYSE